MRTEYIKQLLGREMNTKEREEWVRKTLKGLKNGLRILDAGAGEQIYKKECAHLEYVSQDFCQYNGKGNGEGFQSDEWDTSTIDIVSDITAIPVDSDSFDVILCTEVFEHIPYPDLAIREFSRILKKEGILILTAPMCSISHMAPYHFCDGFDRYWYERVLGDNGFVIDEIVPNGNYLSYTSSLLYSIPSMLKRSGKRAFAISALSIFVARYLGKWKTPDETSEFVCFGYFIKAHRL